jgi:gliding motility-associated-like protein
MMIAIAKRLVLFVFGLTFSSVPSFSQGLNTGLLSNYPFAGTYLDYGPLANHGINLGTTFVTDYCAQPNNAVSFAGNSSISLTYKPAAQIQPPLSFTFRVKFTAYNSTEIYSLWANNDPLPTDPGYRGIYVQYYAGEFYFHITNGTSFSSSGRRSYTVYQPITLNQWYTVAVVLPDYTNCSVQINCQPKTVNNNGITVNPISYSQNNGALGRVFYPPTGIIRYFNHQLDDFRLWNRALSTSEMSRLCSQDTSYLNFSTCGTHSFLGATYTAPSVNFIPKGTCGGYYRLALTLPATDTLNVIDSLCSGELFSFRGQTFTAPFDTSYTKLTCDTLFHIKLFLRVADTTTVSDSVCAGVLYSFRTQSFFAPIDTFLNGTTCDTIFHLLLFALPCDTVEIIDTLCFNEVFNFQGVNYTAPENAFVTSTDGLTTYHIKLFVKEPRFRNTYTVFGCPNEEFDTLGFRYNFPFVDTIIYAGCDSALFLNGQLNAECDFDCKPFIPNVFTPNNDGVNDFFELFGGVGPFSLQIFNRWGQMIYSSDDYQNNWDGTFKGEPVADGVYTYYLECLYKNPVSTQAQPEGSPRIYMGAVTIFR